MARKYTIRKTFEVVLPNEVNEFAFDEQIDLAVELSQRLQKNVRQGKEFHVHKAEASVAPSLQTGDFDIGGAVAATVRFCPVTKNSKNAWKSAFNVWKAQKSLRSNAIGPYVRYDDFELALEQNYINSRTSSVYATGIADTSAEKICIYGASTSGTDLTLEDLWESAEPQAGPSRFPLDNSVVKESKFTQEFPPLQVHDFGAAFSTVAGDGAGATDSGANHQSTPVYIADSSCLAGLVAVKGYVIPEDIAGPIADTLWITITLTVSMGPSLLGRARKATKRMSYRKSGRRGNKNRS